QSQSNCINLNRTGFAMTEKLAAVGKVMSHIDSAVKTMKRMRDSDGELFRVIELTKKSANDVEKLDLPDKPQLKELKPQLEELKESLKKVQDSESKLEVWLENFEKEIIEFEKFVETNIVGNRIPQNTMTMKEFCRKLIKTDEMATYFYKAFERFISHLSNSQQVARNLTDTLQKKAEEAERKAGSATIRGAVGTAGLVIGGAGLLALGISTGGAAWIALGAIAGVAGGVVAGVVGRKTVIDVKAMRDLAEGICDSSKKLQVIAKDLKSSSDRAGVIQLDESATEALKTLLEFVKRDLEKDGVIAARDARIAELEKRLKLLGHV
ncbi:hypothetical protein BOX15_Mlig028092g1, partial [Macrostomum lignano]